MTTQSTSAYQHPTTSCISTTRPTPATLVERPAGNIYNAIIPATNITHLAEDHTQPPRTFTYTLVNTTNKLSLVIIVISPLFLHIVLTVLIHIIHLRGRHTYRHRNRIRTVWLNRIAWNRKVWQLNCVLMLNWIVEIELFICIKMDLALNNLQSLIYHKTQTNKHSYIVSSISI